MAVLNGVLYYSERKQLFRADIGRDGIIINETLKNIGNLKTPIKDLKIFDLQRAKDLENPCKKNNGGCEHICFFLGPNIPRKCGCIFSKLNHDGTSCGKYRSFLAYIRGNQIEFAPTFGSLDSDEKHESISAAIERKELVGAFKPIKDADILRGPVAIVADIDRLQLIFSDIKANRLVAIKIDQSQHFVIVQDVKQVEGMAFDEIH
uniref:Uncharacterized protein n=1 Tax=Panagrolaimus sp. ES5 TaxID=591445 RepID=A0AC34GHD4_9BILA